MSMQRQRIPIMLLDGGLGTTLQASPYNITFENSNPLWSSHLLISSPSTLFAVHQAWNNVDYIAFETVRRADEVRAIRGVMHDVLSLGGATRKPWWVSGVFPTAQVDEVDVRRWVRAAFGTESSITFPRPWGIGINCTRVENLHRIVSIMKDELQRLIQQDQFVDEWQTTSQHPHLILYPDGTQGEEYDPVTKEWVQKQEKASIRPWDEVFSQMILEIKPDDWESMILGGCCRVMPQHIAALRQRLGCHQNPESDV